MYLSDHIKSKILESRPCYFPKSFPKIFSWDQLEKLLNLRPFVNNKRFKIIGEQNYSWENQTWLSDINTYPPSLLEIELKKHHCYFSDSSRVNKEINGICKELEDIFPECGADAHIYFTISDNLDGGFGIHWDYSHNLIVQVEGSTRFMLWDQSAEQGVKERNVKSLSQDPIYDVVLNEGDAVFVPFRYYHCAISQTKRLSVSFPISHNKFLQHQDRHWIELCK